MDNKQIKKLYYSIGEVAEMTDLKPYVLRYWETEFPQLRPAKNRAGNRKYRESDIKLLFYIKDLLYNQKYTIEGARQQLESDGTPESSDGQQADQSKVVDLKKHLEQIKHGLREILELLDE